MSSISTRAIAATTLVATFVLNLQGTFLRATGSGDGCGTSWPTCHGEVIPLDPEFATVLEFGHRMLSVAVGLIGLVLLFRTIRVRKMFPGLLTVVIVAAVFYVAQTLVGMLTVVGGWTGESTDPIRAVILPIHLVNSFTMMGALAVAVLYAGPNQPGRWRVGGRRAAVAVLGVATVALYGLTFTGGVAALGNMFAPVDTVAEGVAMDFSPDAHWTVRLRVLHPVIAMTLGTGLLVACGTVTALRRTPGVWKAARWLGIAYVAQLGIGVSNWLALAPLPLSMTHQALAMVVVGLFAVFVTRTMTDSKDAATSTEVPDGPYLIGQEREPLHGD